MAPLHMKDPILDLKALQKNPEPGPGFEPQTSGLTVQFVNH